MNTRQKQAVKKFAAFLQRECEQTSAGKYQREVTNYEVLDHACGLVFVSAQLEHPRGEGEGYLEENNLLRALDHEYWMVSIRSGGMIEVNMCAKSMRQFAGKRAFGMKFSKTVS